MSVTIQRPPGVNVGVNNPNDALYIKGNNTTDGSLRIIPDTSFETEAEFQLRSNGVWNDTGILIAASTVYLGRELQISAGGEWMLTKDEGTDIRSLVPHVRFDPNTGTDETVVVPVVGALNEDVIIQPDDTGESEQNTFQFTGAAGALVLANALILKTGSTAATDNVMISLYRNGFGSGLFYRRTYPVASFPANTDITLTTDGLVELFANEIFYIEITVDDGGFLNLKTDVTNTTPYWGGNFYFVTEDTITPDQLGGATRYLTFDNEGYVVCDNQGYAVLGDPNDVEVEPDSAPSSEPFGRAATFSASTSTESMSNLPLSHYRFTGTSGGTLTLSDSIRSNARGASVWSFTVKDEGGNCTASPLTIAAESNTVDGASSIQIITDYGSVLLYTDGTNYWSV